jgi:hypothetical protein
MFLFLFAFAVAAGDAVFAGVAALVFSSLVVWFVVFFVHGGHGFVSRVYLVSLSMFFSFQFGLPWMMSQSWFIRFIALAFWREVVA